MLIGLLSMAATGAQAQEELAGFETVASGEANVRTEVSFSPVLHIELGPGATSKDGDKDIVTLDLNTAEDYRQGVKKRVNRQLKVFAIGTGYYVNAGIDSDHLNKIMQLDVGTAGYELTPVSLLSNMRGHGGAPKGAVELDAMYAIKPMTADNFALFKDLMGKARTHRVGITYTILPD